MKGPKPTPSHLAVLKGGRGAEAARERLQEPQPEGDLFAPPGWLSPDQQEGWRYAIAHAPRGLLRNLDASLLAVWVVAEDLHRTAAQAVKQYGLLVKSPKQGAPMQSPYMAIINRQAEIMMRAASELGFTPTSRTRITLGAGEKEKNRFAKHAAKRA